MKKICLLILCVAAFAGMVTAQQQLGAPDLTVLGNEAGAQTLAEIPVDSFEREGAWTAKISPDNGIITVALRDGGADAAASGGAEPEPVDGEPQGENTKVLGVKVEFFRRGVNTFYINSLRPIPIEGEVKTVSVWVAGRNQPHTLYLVVQDYYGSKYELRMGTLDFSGWNKMTVNIPASDGEKGIVQSSVFYGDKPGLRIVGFKVDCAPQYTRGAYYIYFDDLRAITDLYLVQNRDANDMQDDW